MMVEKSSIWCLNIFCKGFPVHSGGEAFVRGKLLEHSISFLDADYSDQNGLKGLVRLFIKSPNAALHAKKVLQNELYAGHYQLEIQGPYRPINYSPQRRFNRLQTTATEHHSINRTENQRNEQKEALKVAQNGSCIATSNVESNSTSSADSSISVAPIRWFKVVLLETTTVS